jgi:hypothetical protein
VNKHADLLATVLAGWLLGRARPVTSRPRYRKVIAIDGKTLRGARRSDGSQVHLLSALDTSTGIVLAQVTVAAKSNEIRRCEHLAATRPADSLPTITITIASTGRTP